MKRNLLLTMLLVLVASFTNMRAANLYADLDASTHGGSNGSYDTATHVYTWTGSTDSRVVLSGLSGDLSGYENLVLDFTMGGDYSSGATIRIDIITNNSDGTTTQYTGTSSNGAAFYSAGTKTVSLTKLVTSADALKDVNAVRINTNSSSGSATINSVYLTEPEQYFSLEFDSNGVCDVPLDMLTATTATYDSATGTVTSEGSGSIALKLSSDGIDMSSVYQVVMEITGDQLVNDVQMTSSAGSQHWYSSKYTQTFTGDTVVATAVTSPVTSYKWNLSSTSGTMVISSLKIYNTTATAVEKVAVATPAADNACYDLSGRRLPSKPTQPGIYIMGGRKVVVK